jgi:Zn finger protein HypA/HybF involved in hydrogenase expression
MVLEGKCQRCGYNYVGWSLRYPQHRFCPKCGAKIKITKGSQLVIVSKNASTFIKRAADLLNTPIILKR